MRLKPKQFASYMGQPPGRRIAVAAFLLVCTVVAAEASAQGRVGRKLQERADEARRREGEALVNLADGAMSGHAASDFTIHWNNDFFKAQSGTFVPFTVTVERSKLTAPSALMYLRAVRRDAPSVSPARGRPARYPFDIIFPVEISGSASEPLQITRGFAVPPGEYDVYVALRERAEDPLASEPRLKAAVLKQPLTVPDFWTGELTTSSVMLADRIDALPDSIGPDDVLERPYVIGRNEVHLAAGSVFRKTAELVVVFLIYNPSVTGEKNFDIQVDYHVFRRMVTAAPDGAATSGMHPPARAGERYVTRTNPQRFTPSVMGAPFDPSTGQPLMAGQGILLSSFQEGEYRLGITVTDLMSRRTLSRDVTFTVAGS
ncbi:MAG: hypothetical protein ABJC89_02380 [Acidobacteriota bacterium]